MTTPAARLRTMLDQEPPVVAPGAFNALFAKLIPDIWERAERLAAWSVNFDKKDISQSLVDEAHARGYKVLVYTVNSPGDIRRILDFGVDGIFTDYPDRFNAVMSATP